MRLFSSTLCGAVAIGLFAGCTGNNPSPSSAMPSAGSAVQFDNARPQWSKYATIVPARLRPTGPMRLRGRQAPLSAIRGIYASEYYGSSILGYPHKNRPNGPPTCSVSPASYVHDVAVDGQGNLIDPDGGTHTIIVYSGASMCGPLLGTIADPYGQPSDAASANAATGTIAVANVFDNSDAAGSISLCTMSGGCTSNLTNPNMYKVAGVAMDKKGNCWASALNESSGATLTYFAGCTGAGVAATGFENSSYGGLDIDRKGNLVSIDIYASALYVYSGCNPACTLVGGPFPLEGESAFGHVGHENLRFTAGDFANGQVDIYCYSATGLYYMYSFNNGLSASLSVEGAAYIPRSRE